MKFYLKATFYEPECAINTNILFLGLSRCLRLSLKKKKKNSPNIKTTIYFGMEHYCFQAFPHIFSSDTNVLEMQMR